MRLRRAVLPEPRRAARRDAAAAGGARPAVPLTPARAPPLRPLRVARVPVSRAAAACAQVFRCRPRAKGWGVRCKRRIPAGGFVSEYAGELLNEAQAHARGVARGDEYLFDLDAWAHDVARERLERENLKAVVADDDEAPATPAAERADAVENSAIDQTERGLLIIDAKRCASVSRARFAASLRRGPYSLSLSLSLSLASSEVRERRPLHQPLVRAQPGEAGRVHGLARCAESDRVALLPRRAHNLRLPALSVRCGATTSPSSRRATSPRSRSSRTTTGTAPRARSRASGSSAGAARPRAAGGCCDFYRGARDAHDALGPLLATPAARRAFSLRALPHELALGTAPRTRRAHLSARG